MVVREELEAIVDSQFSSSSYGYRPHKSAHQAIEQCRENCMNMDWAIDLDIKGFFDEIDHDLMLSAFYDQTTYTLVRRAMAKSSLTESRWSYRTTK